MLPKSNFEPLHAIPFIDAIRLAKPVVHCITNDVVQAFTANVLLAIGASPAMIVAEEEVEGFAAIASAVLINVGTIHRQSAKSMLLAAAAAHKHNTPWVLDPVAVGVLPYRTEVVQKLLLSKPVAIRGNASEILTLAGRSSSAKSPDSMDTTFSAVEAAEGLAAAQQCIVAVTGEVDFVTDGKKTLALHGGHEDLTRITGTGCSLSAMVAAFLSFPEMDKLNAVASACLLMKTAGELAAGQAGLGSFAVSLLDQLSSPANCIRTKI